MRIVRVALSVPVLFALAWIGYAFYALNYPSSECRAYNGTPGARGWLSETKSCSWPETETHKTVELDGRSAKLGAHASGWCFKRKWRISPADGQLVCTNPSTL